MKKCILFFVLFFCISACHHAHCAENKVDILAATFPVWLFTSNICQNIPDVNVQLLIPASAGCPHDFALRPADLQKLHKAQILVINGAGLEEFLTKPIAELEHRPEIIDAGEGLALLESNSHGHINPHIFAAPQQAAQMVNNIARKLSELDPAHGERYLANAASYVHRLIELSNGFKNVGAAAKNKNIAIEHDAIAYMATNAGLMIIAELEHGASPAELRRLRVILSKTLPALLAGDAQYSDRMFKQLAEELNLPFAALNPCASGPEDAPLDYYETVMSENLAILERYFE